MKLNRFAIAIGASLTMHAAWLFWVRYHGGRAAEAPAEPVKIEVRIAEAAPEGPGEPRPTPDRSAVQTPARVRRGSGSKLSKAAPSGRGQERGPEKPPAPGAAPDSPRAL